MEPREVLGLDEIDLSAIDFWGRPWEEREGAFKTLRRERPVAHFDDPEIPPELSMTIQHGNGYYALTKHAHVSEASRHPELYRSGQGANQSVCRRLSQAFQRVSRVPIV